METPTPLWDDANMAHIGRHSVTVDEVEEIVASPASRWVGDDTHRVGRLKAWGVTGSGRHLIVVVDTPTPQNTAYVVTARPMTTREKASFQGGTR
jgi:uncharacterized DUF497 family protein